MDTNNSSGPRDSFGIMPKSNWYADNKGKPVTFVLYGGSKCGGIIHEVYLEDGEVGLKPYLGKDWSHGKPLDCLVEEEERVSLLNIVVKTLHPKGFFAEYVHANNPHSPLLVIPQSDFIKKE